MLSKQSQSPSSPSKRALDELIKGCELAIYNTAFTLKELNDLRAESQVQQLKKSRSKRQMAPVQGLQVQEARGLISLRNERNVLCRPAPPIVSYSQVDYCDDEQADQGARD
jgi:hypothetical protein